MSSRQQEATAAEGHWGTAPCSRQDRPDRHCLEELLGLEELEGRVGLEGRLGPFVGAVVWCKQSIEHGGYWMEGELVN